MAADMKRPWPLVIAEQARDRNVIIAEPPASSAVKRSGQCAFMLSILVTNSIRRS